MKFNHHYLNLQNIARLLFIGAVATVSPAVHAMDPAETFRTTTGAVFTIDVRPGFGRAVQDPSRRIWSKNLGRAANDYFPYNQPGTVLNEVVLKSPAADLCAAIGAQLPSRADYSELVSNFEQRTDESGTPLPTEQARKELLELFPDLVGSETGDLAFWSSTTLPINGSFLGYQFYVAYTGNSPGVTERKDVSSVRCVIEP